MDYLSEYAGLIVMAWIVAGGFLAFAIASVGGRKTGAFVR